MGQCDQWANVIRTQISGQAIVGAIDYAIDAGFSENPQALTPNGAGFSFQTGLGQPAAAPTGSGGNRTEGRVRVGTGAGTQRAVQVTAGSLANGLQGGNGAPPGTRLIDMPVMPLPPGSGMPPIGETQFSSDELVFQFASGTTPQQIDSIAQRFGLSTVAQETIGILRRTVYTFRIANGQSVREVIRRVEAAGLGVAVQPKYAYRLTQDRNPNADLGDPAQYIVNKFHLAEVHQITKGDNAVVAVIDSEIDSNHPISPARSAPDTTPAAMLAPRILTAPAWPARSRPTDSCWASPRKQTSSRSAPSAAPASRKRAR
jgi:hypothetical protein